MAAHHDARTTSGNDDATRTGTAAPSDGESALSATFFSSSAAANVPPTAGRVLNAAVLVGVLLVTGASTLLVGRSARALDAGEVMRGAP